MSYEPQNLKRWTMPQDYFGAQWPEYFGSGCSQHRDSDALVRSNFRCMLRALGGESDTVFVVRESHWAVGWVEWIAIHESDSTALAAADEIAAALEDYPVVDESDFSELETEEADSVWRDCYSVPDRVEYIRDNKSQFEFHSLADLLGCVRGRYFAGYASELLR